MGLNNCVLLGRLTKDPELRYVGEGNPMCRFAIAIDRGLSKDKRMEMEQKGQPTADFINIVSWGKTAELAANYLSKGRQVAIQGRIQTSSYDGQDGNRIYRTDVIADRVEFIGGRNEKVVDGNTPNNNAEFVGNEDMAEIPLNDIPF